ncbi:Hypothetical protein FKW44_018250 [Caligus rogercresseyi]|uniref:Uncharacterized protein n=1 Tax=Caligus rogercresseyi TaxID=217165 RepID=A0A7T8JXK0_CALRO|nr:Hypothetical protein FKW44_018250 [Caligus rogercresseyi]
MQKIQRDDLPSSHPPTSFKLIAAAPRSPRVYFQDKNKTSTTQSFQQPQITMIHIIHL